MKTVLIVDNNDDYLAEICDYIKRSGYNVISCNSFFKAKEIIGKKEFDIAIVDRRLDEDRSGIDVLSLIDRKTPKILISNYKETDWIIEALKIRKNGVLAHDFIYKPDGLPKILEAVNRAISIEKGFKEIEKDYSFIDAYSDIIKEIIREKKHGFTIFIISQISGIILIVLGVVMFYFKCIEVGALSAAGAIISNILSMKFLGNIKSSEEQIKGILDGISKDKRVNTIKSLFKNIDEIDNGKVRDDLIAELILTIKDL